jgi:hypothetical protein
MMQVCWWWWCYLLLQRLLLGDLVSMMAHPLSILSSAANEQEQRPKRGQGFFH